MADPILLLTKQDRFSAEAAAFARERFGSRLHTIAGARGTPFPDIGGKQFAWLLSFLSPWIVPQTALDRAEVALNFHPGSRDYPGIGCYNFALYENAAHYGCVCHHMAARVDTGGIVAERVFPTAGIETVEALKLKTMETMSALFREIVGSIADGRPLPQATIAWSRRPFRRSELEALREVRLDMSAEEVARRVRAVTYPGFPGAELKLHGVSFFSPVPNRKPIA